jgi:hypothetical protein
MKEKIKQIQMAKKVVKIFVNQLTENGAYKYPWIRQDLGEGEFTTSLNTCYFKGKTFTKKKEVDRKVEITGVKKTVKNIESLATKK